jgi:hypothetical protein
MYSTVHTRVNAASITLRSASHSRTQELHGLDDARERASPTEYRQQIENPCAHLMTGERNAQRLK